jgi:hypothetical protein
MLRAADLAINAAGAAATAAGALVVASWAYQGRQPALQLRVDGGRVTVHNAGGGAARLTDAWFTSEHLAAGDLAAALTPPGAAAPAARVCMDRTGPGPSTVAALAPLVSAEAPETLAIVAADAPHHEALLGLLAEHRVGCVLRYEYPGLLWGRVAATAEVPVLLR